jgi:putative aldouronate transport system substrate-binding protein
MNLIFASGDFPDLVSYFTAAYSGTPASAYENDLIVPLNDYLADYSPNYRAWIETNDTYLKSVTSDDGNIYCWYSLNAAPAVEQGSWVRADLIDKFGIDVPTTVSEMEDYFALCKDEGLSSVISCNAYGFMIFSDAFDVPSLSADNGFGIGLFREGNTVESILSADNSDKLKTYMETLHQWYENGYYAADLVSFTSSDDTNINNLIYNGETGYMWSGSGHYANYVQQAAVEGWDIEPTPNIVLNSGDTTHYLANDVIKTNVGSIVMTSACEDIEAACRYVDWFYSDMGINITNYGPEGLTWNWSSDGTSRLFSSAVYADEVYGLGSAPVMMMYNGSTTWASIADSLYNLYYGSSMIAIECQKLWSQNTDSEKYLSTGALSLTTSESEQASTIQSDLNTYLEESLTKFLTGDLSLDTDWDGFISTIEGMGLQDVVDIYQDAYDRYLDR